MNERLDSKALSVIVFVIVIVYVLVVFPSSAVTVITLVEVPSGTTSLCRPSIVVPEASVEASNERTAVLLVNDKLYE